MKTSLFGILLALMTVAPLRASRAPGSPEMTFFKNGKKVRSFSVAQLKKAIGESNLSQKEPHNGADTTYVGVSFQKLLTKVYGAEWKKAKQYSFLCTDG